MALHTLSLEFSASNVTTWLVQAPRAASLVVRERARTLTTPRVSHARAHNTASRVNAKIVLSQMLSTHSSHRAPYAALARVPTLIARSAQAAQERPSPRLVNANNVPLRTLSMVLIRRALLALLVRSLMVIAQRAWHAKA